MKGRTVRICPRKRQRGRTVWCPRRSRPKMAKSTSRSLPRQSLNVKSGAKKSSFSSRPSVTQSGWGTCGASPTCASSTEVGPSLSLTYSCWSSAACRSSWWSWHSVSTSASDLSVPGQPYVPFQKVMLFCARARASWFVSRYDARDFVARWYTNDLWPNSGLKVWTQCIGALPRQHVHRAARCHDFVPNVSQLSFHYDTASRHWAVLDLNALFRNTLEEPITRHSPLECTPMKHDFASKNSETHLKLVT